MRIARICKSILVVLLAAIFILPLYGIAEESIPVKSIQFTDKALTVMVGQTTESLGYVIKPEDASNKNVSWSSADETIATVDQNGAVTGVKVGKTKIQVAPEDTSKGARPAALNVVVIQPVKTLNLDLTETKIGIGSRVKVTAGILPEDATNKKLTWESSDKNIAQVSGNGDITGKGVGTATISCTAADGSGVSATVQVTVFKPVQSLKLDKNKMTVSVGKKSDPIYVTVNPTDAEYVDVTWSSSDESIATVNEKGVVTGVSTGNVKITATSNEPVTGNKPPKSVVCQVQVIQPVEYISLREGKTTNNKLYLNLTVLPETATMKNVTWSSSDTKVATVKNGVVSIKKRDGSATITATTVDGSNLSASCEVNIFFNGIIMISGNCEQRIGTYSWSARNFTEGKADENSAEDDSEEDAEDEPKGLLFMNVPWGSSYPEAQTALSAQGITTKPLAKNNDYLRALVGGDIPFQNVTAFRAGLNFSYDENDPDYEKNNSLFSGNYYFKPEVSFDDILTATRFVYGLDKGTASGDEYRWEKDDVQIILTKKEKYTILEVIKKDSLPESHAS